MKLQFDLKWAQSLDGQLCDDNYKSKWLTGDKELIRTHEIRKQYDAVLVGGNTFIQDFSKLTVRKVELKSEEKQPVRIILDLNNSLLKQIQNKAIAKELLKGERNTYILSTEKNENDCWNEKVYFIPCDFNFSSNQNKIKNELIKVFAFISKVENRKIERVLVEGGAKTLCFFLDKKLFHKIFISLAPVIIGGNKNRIYLNRSFTNRLKLDTKDIQVLGKDIFTEFNSLS